MWRWYGTARLGKRKKRERESTWVAHEEREWVAWSLRKRKHVMWERGDSEAASNVHHVLHIPCIKLIKSQHTNLIFSFPIFTFPSPFHYFTSQFKYSILSTIYQLINIFYYTHFLITILLIHNSLLDAYQRTYFSRFVFLYV